jgi:hypothetical protein
MDSSLKCGRENPRRTKPYVKKITRKPLAMLFSSLSDKTRRKDEKYTAHVRTVLYDGVNTDLGV